MIQRLRMHGTNIKSHPDKVNRDVYQYDKNETVVVCYTCC